MDDILHRRVMSCRRHASHRWLGSWGSTEKSMAQSRKIIAWGVGLGLLLGVAGTSRSEDPEKAPTVSIDADHEPLLVVIKRICATQGLGFVANDAALEKAGKVSLSLHDVPLETALEV